MKQETKTTKEDLRQEKTEQNFEKKLDFYNNVDNMSIVPVVRNISFKTYAKLRRIKGVGYITLLMLPYQYKIGFYSTIDRMKKDLKIKKAVGSDFDRIVSFVDLGLDSPDFLFNLGSVNLEWLNYDN